jgi:hypothetical protein
LAAKHGPFGATKGVYHPFFMVQLPHAAGALTAKLGGSVATLHAGAGAARSVARSSSSGSGGVLTVQRNRIANATGLGHARTAG